MGTKVSEHFTREEFACHDGCGFDTVNSELLDMLENLRKHFGKPIIINCGCRCDKHNAAVGGKPKSQHLLGNAADITVPGMTPKQVQDAFEKIYPKQHGMGRYPKFTHVDCREVPARWIG